MTNASKSPNAPRTDLLLVAFLIALDVTARLLPHAPNFTPITATTLFAAVVLNRRALALLVPLIAMPLSDLLVGFYDWRIMAVVYASMALPFAAGLVAKRYRLSRSVVPAMLSCSLLFFVTTNVAVWAFSGIYSLDTAGLVACAVAALPFLKTTIAGDLLWTAGLFGGTWLVQHMTAHQAGAKAAA